jgi:signal transduction histidine kinase
VRWRVETALIAVVAAVQIGGTALAARQQTDVRTLDIVGYLLLAAGPLALPWRHRWPVPTLWATFAATFAYLALDYPGGPIWLPLIVAFGTALVTGHRHAAYLTLPPGYVCAIWLVPWIAGHSMPSPAAAVGIAAWLLLLAAGSELVRNRRAYQRAARERLIEQQRSHDEEARRIVSEERLRIARELHDVLAHSLSLINVQAGVALELADRKPDQVPAALNAIKKASKEALVEVQSVLTTLRDRDEAAPLTPAAGMAQLDQLIARAAAAGLQVRTAVTGNPRPLPDGVDLTAYRVVQESLTNVVRHAGARNVAIAFDHGSDMLTVQIDDDGRASAHRPHPSAGNGLTGMRERVTGLGGHLEAGAKPGGGFRVRARLPLSQAEETASP